MDTAPREKSKRPESRLMDSAKVVSVTLATARKKSFQLSALTKSFKEAYYSILVNAIVTRIFVLLLRRYMETCDLPRNQAGDSETAMQIARYIQANASDVTLKSLSSEFHYSSEYASRLIKRTTGQTFIQLLTNIRMENAKQLLRDTSLSVIDIAANVGYDSCEHFIRKFKSHTGKTPNEYRHKR